MIKLLPKNLKIFPHVQERNWLIHALMVEFLSEAAQQYASGCLADIGCGAKPYKSIFAPYISRHVGIDLTPSPNRVQAIDVIAEAYQTGLGPASCNTILCTEVLEHLEEPALALREMNRILKPQGTIILTVPFFWPIHEAPRDFYRYSQYGLRYLFEQEGFEIVELKPLTGYIVTFTQLTIYFLRRFQRGYLLKTLGRTFNWAAQHIALKMNRYDRSTSFTNLYALVARKV